MSKVILGTELKLNVNIQPIGGYTMDDYNFDIQLKGGKGAVSFNKKGDTLSDGLSKGDDSDNYIVAFDTTELGVGRVNLRVTAYIPDGAFPDRKRTEISESYTGIDVVKYLV